MAPKPMNLQGKRQSVALTRKTAIHGPKPYELIGHTAIHGPKAYELTVGNVSLSEVTILSLGMPDQEGIRKHMFFRSPL